MPEILNQQLTLSESAGTKTTLTFSQSIPLTNNSGKEQRLIRHRNPRLKFDLSRALFTENDLEALLAFHTSTLGSRHGFLYFDWSDHAATATPDQDRYGGITQGLLALQADGRYQLCKRYSVDGAQHYRPITRPRSDTIRVYVDGVETLDWTVDLLTGIVTFTVQPPAEATVSADFEFWVPVRFEVDQLDYRLQSAANLYSIDSLLLIEAKEPHLTLPPEVIAPITSPFALDLWVDSRGGPEYETEIVQFASHREVRKDRRVSPKRRYQLASREHLSQDELHYILCLYRCCKGRGISFQFEDKAGSKQTTAFRFNGDLQFSPLYLNKEQYLGLRLESIEILEAFDSRKLIDFIDPETFVRVYIDASGSMNTSIAAVTAGMEQLKAYLRDTVWAGNQALADYYFQIINRGDERWLSWLSEDLRQDPNEPDKTIFLVFVNESNSSYHPNEPTATFEADLTAFLAAYQSRVTFYAFLYAVELDTPLGDEFDAHVTNAIAGNPPYSTALEDYGIRAFLDIPPDSPPEYYFDSVFEDVNGISDVGLSAPLLPYATFWLIERTDGEKFGFTDHDADIEIGGILFRATAKEPTAISKSVELETDNTTLDGAFSDDAITEQDLSAGKYDGARVISFIAPWDNPPTSIPADDSDLIRFIGEVGEVSGSRTRYDLSLEGQTAKLNQAVSHTASPLCRQGKGPAAVEEFGDANCGFPIETETYPGVAIQSVTDARTFTVTLPTGATDEKLANGKVVFESSKNIGFTRQIDTSQNGVITLSEGLPYSFAPGDTVTLVSGCDRTFARCQFWGTVTGTDQTANFRGEPPIGDYMPNSDNIYGSGVRRDD